MRIYYLKYYKGNIAVSEHDVIEAPNPDYYLDSASFSHASFAKKYEGEVVEYSLGNISIWITEKGDFKLAYNKLRDYVVDFHNENIKYLNRRISNEEMFLSSVKLLAIK